LDARAIVNFFREDCKAPFSPGRNEAAAPSIAKSFQPCRAMYSAPAYRKAQTSLNPSFLAPPGE